MMQSKSEVNMGRRHLAVEGLRSLAYLLAASGQIKQPAGVPHYFTQSRDPKYVGPNIDSMY